jgi:hypothetical protein
LNKARRSVYYKKLPEVYMSDDNPYQSPQAEIKSEKTGSQGSLTEGMIAHLSAAAPWIRFIGVLGYVGCGFTILLGLGCIIAGPSAGIFFGRYYSTMGLVSLGIIYIALGVLVFFPSMFAYNFGIRIRNYLRSSSEYELEQAFKNNRSLWKFMGILAIIELALLPVLIIAGLIIGFTLA